MDFKLKVKPVPFQTSWAVIQITVPRYDQIETEVLFKGSLCDCYAYIKLHESGQLEDMKTPNLGESNG